MIKQSWENLNRDKDVFKTTCLTADSGFHSGKNLKMLAEEQKQIDCYVADPRMRSRDPLFEHYGRYKERSCKERRKRNRQTRIFTPDDFSFDPEFRFCMCPAGKRLYRNGYRLQLCNYEVTKLNLPAWRAASATSASALLI
jgi:hypothetical protein